jgi:alpha-ketoglutarate-dependent taurine dioxygenase
MQSLGVTGAEPLSTGQFYEELARVDFSQEGPRIRTFSVDLDPVAFIGSLSVGNVLTPIASSDGIVSHVRENPLASTADNSGTSRYFSLHTDGKYLPEVPEMVVLHCVNPGTSEIPTVFVDTKDIIDTLQDIDRLDEAKEYDLIFRNKDGLDFIRPLLEINPKNGEPVMNIAIASPQCHLRPLADSGRTQADADKFYALLEKIAEEDISTLPHTWRKNDAVVFDNLRLVHGRGLPEHKMLEISDFQRHLHRIWLSRKQV